MPTLIDENGNIIHENSSAQNNTESALSPQKPTEEQLYVPPSESSAGSTDAASSVSVSTDDSTPWYGSELVFWLITLLLAVGIAILASKIVEPICSENIGGGGSDIMENIRNFLLTIAPYVVFIGTIVGSILYNAGFTKKHFEYHTGYEYVLSPLSAAGGSVAGAALIVLLILAMYIIAGVIVIAIVLGILSAFAGG